MSINMRSASVEDAPFIFSLINKLAEFEKAADQVKLTLDQLLQDGFSSNPLYFCHILESDGIKAGFTLCYFRYSTWKGKSLYLEDLFVEPEYRGRGLAKLALKRLANTAVNEGCGRFEWQVLDWNEPAIMFYKSIGATLDPEWINCRLEGKAIGDLANSIPLSSI
ncbi:MAG: GNAT family N-acetyltransferase [Bacteriovoracaceae bacterium]|nr:GNAT family N-acetyltransferase [Bacteriovoracaceae bacterium]